MGAWDKLLAWLYSLCILFLSGVGLTVNAASFAVLLAFILVGVDFVTGVMASRYEKRTLKINTKSKKMRWSFAKLAVYTGAIAFTILIGVGLHSMEITITPNIEHTETLKMTLYCVRVEAYFICWIEIVSIIENLRRRLPQNIFLQFAHYIVAVEFVKKIPRLSKFLKEEDTKNVCEDFDEEENMKPEDTNEER